MGDSSSKVFVQAFYKALSNGRSVRESFEFAQAAFEIEIYNTGRHLLNASNESVFTNFILRSQKKPINNKGTSPRKSGRIGDANSMTMNGNGVLNNAFANSDINSSDSANFRFVDTIVFPPLQVQTSL